MMKTYLLRGFMLVVGFMIFPIVSAFQAYAGAENAIIGSGIISLNLQVIHNESAEYPFLLYRNITYVPMTYHLCRFLGLETDWDDSARTLSITRASRVFPLVPDTGGNNIIGEEVAVSPVGYSVIIDGISSEKFDSTWPLLNYKGVTYFPLTWEYAVTMFGWDYRWDPVNGLAIRSKIDSSLQDKQNQKFTTGNADFDKALDILDTQYMSDREYTGALKSLDGKTNRVFSSKMLFENSPHGFFIKFSANPFPFFKNGLGIQAGYYDRKLDSEPVISTSGSGGMFEMQEAAVEFERSELGYLAQCFMKSQFSGSRKNRIKNFKLLSKDENTAVWGLSVEDRYESFQGYEAEFAVDLKQSNVQYIKIKTSGYTLEMNAVE